MDVVPMVVTSCWTSLFAGAMGTVLARSTRYILPACACGFAGRFVRDFCMSLGLTPNWSTVLGAVAVVLVSLPLVRRNGVSPVVLISGVLPLGAALPTFQAITGLMRLSNLNGEALVSAAAVVCGNAGKVFTLTLAIALGLAIGMIIAQRVRFPESRVSNRRGDR